MGESVPEGSEVEGEWFDSGIEKAKVGETDAKQAGAEGFEGVEGYRPSFLIGNEVEGERTAREHERDNGD